MIGLIVDLARQVKGTLRPSAGGLGNTRGWGRGTIVPLSNRTGSSLPLMTLVRVVTPGGARVEPTDTDAEAVLGVVVGYIDASGLLVEADAPDASTVAVLKEGVTAVLIDANVSRGDFAFAAATAGQARGDALAGSGAFGQFVGGGAADQFALVRISIGSSSSGGGGSVAAKEDGSTVVATATAFDFRHGLDVAASGSTAQVAVDESELDYSLLGNLPAAQIFTANFVIDGGGVTISAGQKGHLFFDFACTLLEWELLGDQSGSIVVDLWKDVYSSFPPTVADSMCTGGTKPTIAATTKAQGAPTSWASASFANQDVLSVNVDSATAVQRVTLALRLRRD
jgi:hypothetical protein